MKLIDKNKLLEELKKLKQNLSASPIVVIEDVESLVENFEVKEVNLEKEIKNEIDNLSNLYCYMEDLFNGNEEEGVYPIPEKVTNELFKFAKHFFELGLRSFVTEEDCKFIWKPNDKQMKALNAMKRYCEIATSFDAYTQEIVESLYQDLKKLKEK